MRKSFRLIAVLAAPAVGLGLLLLATPVFALDNVTLRLDFYAHAADAPFSYGVEQGIFAKYGINLKILEGTGSGPTTQIIATGTDRFGYADAYTMAKLASKGLPVKMIASYAQIAPWAIAYFTSENIHSLKDLYGKKISFSAGDAEDQLFPALMNANHLDISKVHIVYLAPQAKQSALMVGSVDAMGASYADQASTIQEETKRPVSYLRYADWGVNPLSFGLIINTKYLSAKSLNCRMVSATSAAFAAAIKDQRGAAAALLKMFPQLNKNDLALTTEQWGEYAQLVHAADTKREPLGYMSAADWDATVALGIKYGDFGRGPPSIYYTNKFIGCK